MTTSKVIRDLDTSHLKCRAWYHAWDLTVTYVSRIGASTVYDTHLVCLRCGTERYDTSVKGHGVISRRYKHPDGYLIQDIEGRFGTRSYFNSVAKDDLYRRVAVPAPDEVSDRSRAKLARRK